MPPFALTVKTSRLEVAAVYTENTIFVPAGFQLGSKKNPSNDVSSIAFEPSMSATQTSKPVPIPESLTNVTREPSGESCPGKAPANPVPIGCCPWPLAFILKSSAEPFLALQNTIVFGCPGNAAEADVDDTRTRTTPASRSDTVRKRRCIERDLLRTPPR